MQSDPELHHRDRCAIVGIGATGYSRNSGRSDVTLASQAALAAIADAGLDPDDIEGVVRCDMDTVRHNDLVESVGLPNVTYWGEVGPGGAMTDASTTAPVPASPAQTARALRLLPLDDDVDTGGFFEAARRGELVIRRCNGCDSVLHVPRMYCRHCRSWDGRWARVSGKGSVYSWTVVTHQVHPAYPVPYTVILVDLDDHPGTRLVGQLPGTPDLEEGMPVEVWFESVGDIDGRDVVLPQWRLVDTVTG